ncbi:MAG: (4Fe-4S)-binding protein [Dysgonamonadaceae bacterium]
MVEYVKDDLVIVWKPEICRHAGVCVKMLPAVYRPKERPWVEPAKATKEELIAQISACPSGALTYYLKK